MKYGTTILLLKVLCYIMLPSIFFVTGVFCFLNLNPIVWGIGTYLLVGAIIMPWAAYDFILQYAISYYNMRKTGETK